MPEPMNVCKKKCFGWLPAGQKNRYTQSTQSSLDAIFLGQIEPELKKTKWNKISDFLSALFSVYQFFLARGRLAPELLSFK
jgi:hypothetical protein